MIGPVLKIALRALARNKARSALTMLGIVIGVGSVIAMVSLGQGAQQQVKQQISSMGANLLIVTSGSRTSGGVRGGVGTANRLTPEDAEAILRDTTTVAAISPGVSSSATVVFGNQNWTARAEGVGVDYLSIRGRVMAGGEFFSNADIRGAARVAVIGQTIATELFGAADRYADPEPLLSRERHRVSLARAALSLSAAGPELESGGDPVLSAHHVRDAVAALDEMIGLVHPDEVLGRVFERFCVGK